MQLDAEDDDQSFYKPPVAPAATQAPNEGDQRLSGETQVEAAPATGDDDE